MDKEYDSFRKNVDMIVTEMPELNQMLLEKIMRDRGFHKKRQIDFDRELGREIKYFKNEMPTELQQTIAWDYIQKKGTVKDMTFTRYRTEKYKNTSVKRSIFSGELSYKNKKYKKGQFLPKDYKD
jgi:hypothetical protein